MGIVLGIPKEYQEFEKRVSVVPESIARAKSLDLTILVERGAGEDAFYFDQSFEESGATIVEKREDLMEKSDILSFVQRPSLDDIEVMKEGAIVVGTLYPLRYPEIVERLSKAKVTAFSLELIPRITRAQSMDVLSSQASVAGYHAAVLAAENSPRLFPMITTAAGTIRPAKMLVIGAGVAGLMAIATGKRLGASVSAFDVRKSAGEDVRSLGARFLETSIDASGSGGYARDLNKEEETEQKELLENAVSQSDIVITAASVPGKTAPRIVSAEMVESMQHGSVIVDVAADSGGNCDLTQLSKTIMHKGVKIIGPANLPAEVAYSSSQMYSRNMLSFIELLTSSLKVSRDDFTDQILASCLITRKGKTVQPGIAGGE